MALVKYIAKGFLKDASKLLDEFLEINSLEFSAFADIWRKHHFSFIYAGRENVIELNQFTQEIFKRTTIFLLSSFFKKQVGATFLLYALYRNQIVEPFVPIRVELPVFKTLKNIRKRAAEERLTSLHYVLDYLFDHALILVAFQTLMRPSSYSAAKRFEPHPGVSLPVIFESALEEFKRSELLEDLLVSFKHYGEHSNSNQWLVASGKVKEFMAIDQHHLNRREVTGQASSKSTVTGESGIAAEAGNESDVATEAENESSAVSHIRIGPRRVELKAVQFARNMKDSDFPTETECPITSDDAAKNRVCKIRCPKKSKRMVEDKKLKDSDEESDINLTEVLKSKLPKPSVRRPHEKPLRIRRYYKEKPLKGCRQFVGTVYMTDSEKELFF